MGALCAILYKARYYYILKKNVVENRKKNVYNILFYFIFVKSNIIGFENKRWIHCSFCGGGNLKSTFGKPFWRRGKSLEVMGSQWQRERESKREMKGGTAGLCANISCCEKSEAE